MSSFLNAVVEGMWNVVDVAQASIKPFKVTPVKPEDYKKLPVKAVDGHMTLFKRPGSMEAILSNEVMNKHFSIFRLTNDTEALTQFRQYSSILNALVHSSSSVYDENMLQKISDTIKAYPLWRPVHIAAYVGLYECFHHKNIQCDVNKQVTKTLLSPLMTAVLGKSSQCLTVLLELGARLDLQDQYGDTVYHHAVIHQPDVIHILAKHDAPRNGGRVIDYLNNKGWTALASACQKGKSQVVEMLLDAGADPNVTAQEMFPIHFALKGEDNKSVELICERFKDQLSVRDGKYGGTAMHWARNRQMVEKLCREKADMNVKSQTGHTPLHIMQTEGRADCVMELLCWGADPSIGDEDGNTPLHIAVIKDDEEMVKNFVVYGADVNVKNKKNESPRHLASTSNGKNKELILYMLHVSGALRCDDQKKNCLDGCYVNGVKNGKPDEHINELLERDQSGLLDEMLSSMCEPLSQLDGSEKDPGYRLLSLDGGGIRGIVLCLMLIAIEKEVGKPIIECFDWIAGTSTGGLLALGICTGKPLSYIRGLYLRLKDEVFTGSRPYQSENFEAMLKQEFGENTVMTDFKKPRAVVTGVLADRHPTKLHLFRTYEPTLQQLEVKGICQRQGSKKKKEATNSKEKRQSIKEGSLYCPAPPSEQKVWEAARASGAAPTYFKAFGPYIDGGLDANNPTLDLMTEIHEYNCGLKLRNEPNLVRPIGVIVSLGTGQVPIRPVDTVDVYRPEGIFDVTKIARGIQNLINVMVDKATIAEGRPVDRSRAWCGMLGVPFYRFSPPISEVEMDEHDNKKLTQLMWETQCYIVANKDRIKRLASYLRRDS